MTSPPHPYRSRDRQTDKLCDFSKSPVNISGKSLAATLAILFFVRPREATLLHWLIMFIQVPPGWHPYYHFSDRCLHTGPVMSTSTVLPHLEWHAINSMRCSRVQLYSEVYSKLL